MDYYTASEFEPDCSIGYLARCIHQIGGQMLEPVFVEQGLTLTQWSALVTIWFERGRTCADLARDMAHDKGAMTRLVDVLEANGWVTRERDADDRRAINLALTEEGRAVTVRCRERVVTCWNAWLKDWDRDEVATLIGLMQKLRGTLDAAAMEGRGA